MAPRGMVDEGCGPVTWCMGKKMSPFSLRLSTAQFVVLVLVVVPAAALDPLHPKVGEVKGYVKLNSWGNSSLYQLLTDSDYETEPLLAHLVGSRYGESFNHIVMVR